MKKNEVDFKNVEEITLEKEPKKCFSKKLNEYMDYIKETQNVNYTDIKNYIGATIGVDSRTIDTWKGENNNQEPKITPLVKFAILSDTSLDELLRGTEIDIEEDFAKRTGLNNEIAKATRKFNKSITWDREFKYVMETLHLNYNTLKTMTDTFGHQTRKSECLLWGSRELIIVTFSQLLNYFVSKDKDIIEILRQLSDILNSLQKWKEKKDRTELIKKLKCYGIEDERAYIFFKDSINDDEKLKKELNAVETSVSNIIIKIVKQYILDEFRNLPSEKSEKSSNSN